MFDVVVSCDDVSVEGIVVSVGVANLHYVDMNSSRNLFVFGLSIMLGLMIPGWLDQHPTAINTGESFWG